jgi:antitoxin CptB
MTSQVQSLGRLKWHSRRALLELDLVLDRYWRRLGDAELGLEQAQVMGELLQLEDHDLWDMMNGRLTVDDPRWKAMIDDLMKP